MDVNSLKEEEFLKEKKWWDRLVEVYLPNKPLVPIRIWEEILQSLLMIYQNSFHVKRITPTNWKLIQISWLANIESAILALPQSCNYSEDEKDLELETAKFAIDNLIIKFATRYTL